MLQSTDFSNDGRDLLCGIKLLLPPVRRRDIGEHSSRALMQLENIEGCLSRDPLHVFVIDPLLERCGCTVNHLTEHITGKLTFLGAFRIDLEDAFLLLNHCIY